jgi:glycosyltransferase involved in cell wall biosynthesis
MISVIVSVYNVEGFIDRCINSLLQQTYEDYEIILVDDGSPDNCPRICDEWVKKDKRIKVIHKQNGGLSSARNCGIENAKGRFIIFPDPDDWVEPNYLEKLLAARKEYDADLSICERFHINKALDEYKGVFVMDTEAALEKLMMPEYYCGFAWNKLFDLDVIKHNNLLFDEELGMAQDLHFCVRYFQYCKKIAYDTTPLYHYCVDTGGVTSGDTPLTPRKISGLLTYKKIAEIAHDKYPRVEEISYSSLCKLCLKYMVIYYKFKMNSKEMLINIKKEFCEFRKIFYRCDAYSAADKRFARLAVIHPYLYYTANRIEWHITNLMNR